MAAKLNLLQCMYTAHFLIDKEKKVDQLLEYLGKTELGKFELLKLD